MDRLNNEICEKIVDRKKKKGNMAGRIHLQAKYEWLEIICQEIKNMKKNSEDERKEIKGKI